MLDVEKHFQFISDYLKYFFLQYILYCFLFFIIALYIFDNYFKLTDLKNIL